MAAVGTGDGLSWKFSADTVRTARDLYIAVEDMPTLAGTALGSQTNSYFRLRRWVRDHYPQMFRTFGVLELWQIIGWIIVLCLAFVLALLVSAILAAAIRLLIGGRRLTAEHEFRWPLRFALTFSIYKLLIPAIGLPELVKRISIGTTGLLLALSVMWGGWRLIDMSGEYFFRRSAQSASSVDNIVVSLGFGALKLALIAGGLIFIAMELSLPYEGVLAGLSIGGLAVAFASKETLSNVFGAGILAIDRPFRRGDWIIAGDAQGTVEHVGIRSTRIRTGQDSLVIVPNGKLSDATVNNLGTRRYHFTTTKLPISYSTSADAIEAFAKGTQELVEGLPQALPQKSQVVVTALGRKGVELEVTLCLDGRSGINGPRLIDNLMLDMLRLGERLGVKFGEQENEVDVSPRDVAPG